MTRIGILGAMDIEVDHLKEQLANVQVTREAGTEFFSGTFGGVEAVVAMCGIGKVNAALCAHTLIERFGVSCVINTGVAGAVDERLHIGDLVVSTDAVQHDMDVRVLGYAPGQIPDMDVLAFPASSSLGKTAQEAARAVAPDVQVMAGRVASGDQFVGTADQRERIVSTFGALCCEMEGAAIAQVCHVCDVPFVVVRAISDQADGSADVDYPSFKVQAAARCGAIVERLCRSLSQETVG